MTPNRACVSVHVRSICYDLEGASSKLIMLDSGCCVPPVDGAPTLCDIEDEEVEVREAPTGPPAGLNEEEEEGSRPPGRSGCVSVLTSSSSSSSSSSMLGQADWSSTRFKRSFRALRASCLGVGRREIFIIYTREKYSCVTFDCVCRCNLMFP